MTRITSFLALIVFAGGATFGASRPESATYIEGNLSGVEPNTRGTLVFSGNSEISFRTDLATIAVPYASIEKAELGATKVHSPDVPLYKVWSLHKRFNGRTETQYLTIGFKNGEGEDQSMTLELSHVSASNVLSQIQTRTGKNEQRADGWWGDNFWKTTRNADRWSKAPDKP